MTTRSLLKGENGWRVTLRRTAFASILAAAGISLAACGTPSATKPELPPVHVVSATTTTSPSSSAHASTTTSSTTTTTKPASIPACGSTRDPFDPTNTPPPAGSPAICP